MTSKNRKRGGYGKAGQNSKEWNSQDFKSGNPCFLMADPISGATFAEGIFDKDCAENEEWKNPPLFPISCRGQPLRAFRRKMGKGKTKI